MNLYSAVLAISEPSEHSVLCSYFDILYIKPGYICTTISACFLPEEANFSESPYPDPIVIKRFNTKGEFTLRIDDLPFRFTVDELLSDNLSHLENILLSSEIKVKLNERSRDRAEKIKKYMREWNDYINTKIDTSAFIDVDIIGF